MKSKEGILKMIKKAGKKGMSVFTLAGTKSTRNANYILTKQFLEDLLNEGKVEKNSSGKFIVSGSIKNRRAADYVTQDELEKITKKIYQGIVDLNEKVDKIFEYIDEVFLNVRMDRSSNFPTEKDMLIAYDNVNIDKSMDDFVPVSNFKKELKKMGFLFTNKDLDAKLSEMNKRKIIHLRVASSSKKGKNKKKEISAGGKGKLPYITWLKRD
ncbi:MAG: hypothetical protein J7J57_01050 [Caldisericaceae bacterium]|nr:hypothetical protein [Caldisericaceae bacterium]